MPRGETNSPLEQTANRSIPAGGDEGANTTNDRNRTRHPALDRAELLLTSADSGSQTITSIRDTSTEKAGGVIACHSQTNPIKMNIDRGSANSEGG